MKIENMCDKMEFAGGKIKTVGDFEK